MHVIITALACLLGTILWQRDAVALDYPTHPVRVIIPFTPGGAPDVLLRIVARQLQEKMAPRSSGRKSRRR
jgi:tripartite-type tricarboxylate transporter receptor subunit TctC